MAIFTPKPYQPPISDHILEVPRCGIWSSMGSGKTVASLNAIDTLLLTDSSPILVIAPLRVARSTWPEEAAHWCHLKYLRIVPVLGTVKQRQEALRKPAEIHTINIEALPWLIEYLGDRWPYKTVIIDESSRLNGFRLRGGTARAKALGKIAHTKIERFIELTGTPCSNGLASLWGSIWFLDKGERLGRTYDSFKNRWFRTSHDGWGLIPLAHAQAEIQEKLKDICLTIDVKDYLDIAEPVVNNIYVELPVKTRKMYSDMEKEMFVALASEEVTALNAAAKTQKCLQIASGIIYKGDPGASREWEELHDQKLQALEEIVEEAAGMPVLVAYNFKADLERLLKEFPQGRYLDQDAKTITDWNAGKIPILFCHPASAGHGLSLQHGGNILVYFSVNWNLEQHLQIAERIGPTRQKQSGYDRPVFVHHILTRDTVDELVLERIETKREVQDILLAAMKRKGY